MVDVRLVKSTIGVTYVDYSHPGNSDYFKSPSLEPQLVIRTRRSPELENILCLSHQNYFLMA